MVIVVAEGAGQDLIVDSLRNTEHDASGNKLFLDVGLWLSQKIKVCSLFFCVILIYAKFFVT
jgi:6-phosphofructokinase 1